MFVIGHSDYTEARTEYKEKPKILLRISALVPTEKASDYEMTK